MPFPNDDIKFLGQNHPKFDDHKIDRKINGIFNFDRHDVFGWVPIPPSSSTFSMSSSKSMGAHQECIYGILVLPKVQISSGYVVALWSSSSKSNIMNVKYTKNQFWSKISIIWASLNSMLILLAQGFVNANKSHNLLYKLLNTIVAQFTWIPYSAKTTELINFFAT